MTVPATLARTAAFAALLTVAAPAFAAAAPPDHRVAVDAAATVALRALDTSAPAAAGRGGRTVPAATDAPATCRGLPAVVVADGDFQGTDGDDVVVVVAHDVDVHTGAGNDVVCAYGVDVAHGARIYGDGGDDVLVAYSGRHRLDGGTGTDVLIHNGGTAELWGGDGDDVLNAAGSTTGYLHGEGGHDDLVGSPGWDTIDGGDGDDLLFGWDGGDQINGGPGDDSLFGGAGWDVLSGQDGGDACHDQDSATDGAAFYGCETTVVTPVAPDGLAG